MAQDKDLRQIFTVSKLTREIKILVEERFPLVWITGEISNFSLPASGHAYFSLKDTNAVISGVMFKHQRQRLRFNPENGIKIIGMGRLSLYEPRGSYQLIFEHMEPSGTGALQAAYEQLKQKLALEGLFDGAQKKEIPFLPGKISIVTSPSGAVIQDIINVSKRRFSNIPLEVVGVKVQGEGAELEIARAIALINQRSQSEPSSKLSSDPPLTDLIIVARGGGSLEDLAAFNSEIVARAIFNSKIPVISAVGHETDYTIADFVSDLRAPTPSAAAELALPEKTALFSRINQLKTLLIKAMGSKKVVLQERILELSSRLKDPRRAVDDLRFRLEDLESRLLGQMKKMLKSRHERLNWFTHALYTNSPEGLLKKERENLDTKVLHLVRTMHSTLEKHRGNINKLTARLEALNPMGVLDRGYSITRSCPEKTILMDSTDTEINKTVEIILARGRLYCQVKEKNGKEKNI